MRRYSADTVHTSMSNDVNDEVQVWADRWYDITLYLIVDTRSLYNHPTIEKDKWRGVQRGRKGATCLEWCTPFDGWPCVGESWLCCGRALYTRPTRFTVGSIRLSRGVATFINLSLLITDCQDAVPLYIEWWGRCFSRSLVHPCHLVRMIFPHYRAML